MKDALKKLDKKFLIFAGCLILIPIVIIMFLAMIQGCGNKKITYEKYENKMIQSAKKYFKKSDSIPKEESEYVIVDLDTLVEKEYIKSTEKLLNDDTCEGNVTVRRNGVNKEENEGYLNYTVSLSCNNYKTNSLKNLVLEDLTSVDSGLYKVDKSYIFKGVDVDNYLNFYGTLYRIVSIDENGIAKILKTESEPQNFYWDMKYNSEIKQSFGKNIYKDSYILEKLNKYYNEGRKIKQTEKSKIVAYDICVDSRDTNNYSLSHGVNCQKILENQKISLLNVTDFANASLDSECTGINSKSCRNYNYMSRMGIYTWTMDVVSNNTYQVYYLENGTVNYQNANQYYSYNIVLYIDANELVSSGNGKEKTPYIIK